jgi:SpoVK/Ycf46/Vps4 family AAA+-type ATPase
MDLYRVDLASIVSIYIGETEKNLSVVFEYSPQMNVVLLFDDADDLFGKRNAVKDSHDRYANPETNYVLQLFEAYPGLIILTSNLRAAFDHALIQHMTWNIEFVGPETGRRLSMWRRVLMWPGLEL